MKRLIPLPAVLLCATALAAEAPLGADAFHDYRAADLCADLAADFSRQRLAVLDRHLSFPALFARIFPPGMSPALVSSFVEGGRGSIRSSLENIFVRDKAAWQPRLQGREGVDLRCTVGSSSEAGVRAVDFFIETRPEGLVIVDLRDYSMGQRSSDALRGLYGYVMPSLMQYRPDVPTGHGPGAAAPGRSPAGALSGAQGLPAPSALDDARLQRVMAFVRAIQSGDMAAARARFDELPESARNEPALLLRLLGALRSDDALYREYLGRLSTVVKDDPGYAFILFDHYYMTQDRARLLSASREVERWAPGFVPVLMLGVVAEQRSGSAAGLSRQIARLLESDDGFEPAYWVIVEEACRRKDFDTAVLALQVLTQRFRYDFTRTKEPSLDYMRELWASPPFKAWIGTLGPAAGPG
ncbi:MAG TPA: hypothetical protein VFV15_04700 [Moraxellaceae bacterium]|nr:hypothetical protein [Moraxellaceae bacterium]